ncbi:MAG: lipopolysaccharide biosynthesis protein [Lachnospiraceae bacterium]|nr:lipopolysaccharide biosynthesis protein [Lachnospiraceae bacterium]
MSNDNVKSKVFSNMAWKFAERILAQGVSFIVSIVLARILLREDYGIVAMVMVFINIANVFVTSGFGSSLIQKKEADETDFSTIFYCSFISSLVIYGILFMAAPLVAQFYRTPQLTPVLRVFGLKIIISSFSSIQHAYVSKHMMFRKFFFSTLFGTLFSGIVGIVMAVKGYGVWALVAQYLTNTVVDVIVLTITVHWRPKKLFSVKSAKELMSFGWKMLAASLIGTLYGNLRSLVIGRFYTKDDLACYSRGKNFPDLITNNVVASIASVLFPVLSEAGKDKVVVKQMTRRSLKLSSYIVFPLLGGLAAVAEPLTMLLLTEKWQGSIIFMQLICIYSALHTVTEANLQSMSAMGRSDTILKLEFIKKPVGILMVLLAVQHSVLAVGISLPLYSVFSMTVNMMPNRKIIDYKYGEQIKDLLPATILTLVMFVVTYGITFLEISYWIMLPLQIIVGIIIYVGLSVLTKNETFYYLIDFVKKRKHTD